MEKYEVHLTDEDRQRMATLYKEILERKEQMAEITKRTIAETHPGFAEKLKTKTFDGPITISPLYAVLKMCVGSGEDMCMCYADGRGQCWICSSEYGYK